MSDEKYDSRQDAKVIEKWQRDIERNKAKASAFKQNLKNLLKEQLRAEGQRAALGKDIVSASQNPNQFLPKREAGWDPNDIPDTGLEPRLWERD